MKLFKRKKSVTANLRTDALAARIAGSILRRQTRLAQYLNRKTQHWNKASKLTALGVFVLLFGGVSLWFIIHAFLKTTR